MKIAGNIETGVTELVEELTGRAVPAKHASISLSAAEVADLVAELDERFALTVTAEHLQKLNTFGDLVALVERSNKA